MPIKTREKLIEVARQLFVMKGVGHTTMDDIANAASKGRRTIYTYFKSKREIYSAVLESESRQVIGAMQADIDAAGSAEAKLGAFLRHRLAESPLTHGNSFKTWLSFDSRRTAKVNRLVDEKANAILDDIIDSGCQSGVFLPQRALLVKSFMKSGRLKIVSAAEADNVGEIDTETMENLIKFIISDLKAVSSPSRIIAAIKDEV